MTVKELHGFVGETVEVIFLDGEVRKGVLGFTPEFCSEYGYRKPNYFTIGDIDFKVSHIKAVKLVGESSVSSWDKILQYSKGSGHYETRYQCGYCHNAYPRKRRVCPCCKRTMIM